MSPIATAARLLREAAEELKQCHTRAADGNDWTGEPEAKAAYDEHMATAQALEAMLKAQHHKSQERQHG